MSLKLADNGTCADSAPLGLSPGPAVFTVKRPKTTRLMPCQDAARGPTRARALIDALALARCAKGLLR